MIYFAWGLILLIGTDFLALVTSVPMILPRSQQSTIDEKPRNTLMLLKQKILTSYYHISWPKQNAIHRPEYVLY